MDRIALFIDGSTKMSEFGRIIQDLQDVGLLIYGHHMDFQESGVFIEAEYDGIEDIKGTIDNISGVSIDHRTMEEWDGQQEEVD